MPRRDPRAARSVTAGSWYSARRQKGYGLELYQAKLVTEVEWQLEYYDSAFEDLVAALHQIPTRVIAEATGYYARTVRRLKRGEFRPSDKQSVELLRLGPGSERGKKRSP